MYNVNNTGTKKR